MQGREKEWNTHLPITDVGYFIGAVNTMSEIPSDIPKRAKFFSSYKGRVHLVSSVDSKSQTHLLLDPELPLRKRIINQLVEASKTYDGLQIDWELVPADDKENFLAFLKKLREQLGKKTLSVAIPARMRPLLRKDPYAYSDLVPLVDKIIVMAYDEHWSTSAPGAIASTDWCKKIADYSLSVIPSQKLVMGVSFYGRTWSNDSVGNRAWYNSGVERIKRENGVAEVKRDSYGVPHFTFTKTVKITGWYDDVQSLNRRCKMYKDSGVSNLAFWRIGQEDPAFWEQITLK